MADCLVITGATATGKSDIAIAVAQRIGGEIISMDSRQVYKGMDIGTAKPTPEQQALVPHHGIDLLSPSERYSAGRYAQQARLWLEQITARDRVPVLVGGTGFFLRALTHPLFEEPQLEPVRREQLRLYLNSLERDELYRWIAACDPVGAERLHADAGRQRISRMLEVVLLTGRPLDWWYTHSASENTALVPLTIVIDVPRADLYERINQRVDQMIARGLVNEVAGLLAAGYNEESPGLNTVGYTELIPHCRGETTLEEAVDAIKRASRAYARRQLTWFRHQLAGPVIHLDATPPPEEVVDTIVNHWREHHAAHRN